MTLTLLGIAACLVVVAMLYASVGHGGASGYLAVFALWSISETVARPTALCLNLIVAGLGCWHFGRAGFLPWRTLLPFIVGSMPFAFLGNLWAISDRTYQLGLGVVLLMAATRFMFAPNRGPTETHPPRFVVAVVVGLLIGTLSGLTGTGGGIFLTPLLILFGWADTKSSAGISAAFIWANSFAGLLGQVQKGLEIPHELPTYIVAATLGGALGSSFGAKRFNTPLLRRLLALVLLVACFKLFRQGLQ